MLGIPQYKFYIIFILFSLGLFFIYSTHVQNIYEGMNSIGLDRANCPNLLVKRDGKFLMYNTKRAEIPGVNPIVFDHLEDYKEFMKWLRSQGIRCPVLYLERTNDTQGQDTYRLLPDPEEPNAGLPPQRPFKETKLFDAGHNEGSMPGFDSMNQYIGDYTPLDKMFHQTGRFGPEGRSANPMDLNFGGEEFAEEVVESGAYADDTVTMK